MSEGSQLIIPAKLTKAETKRVQQMAIDAFRACDLSGMARVDFLMEPGISTAARPRKIYLNEVNTLPGIYCHQHVPQAMAGQRAAPTNN